LVFFGDCESGSVALSGVDGRSAGGRCRSDLTTGV
jgi:hypothetical protein